MHRLSDWLDTKRKVLVAVIAVAAAIVGLTLYARADSPTKASPIALPTVNAASWTGCGVGIGASFVDAEVSGFMGPVNFGADGQMLDGRFLCDVQMGGFVVGFNVDYGKVFGDLETLGVNNAWAIGGRVGPLVNPSTLLFASGGWSRADYDGGSADGWYLGGGIETKLPNSPLYLVLEYQHRVYEADCGPCEVSADVIRAGVNIKLHFWK